MRNTKEKALVIVALVVCVIGLGVGFATFTSQLTISTKATVTPEQGKFIVRFSSSSTSLVEGTVTPSNALGSNAVIDNTTNPKITNLHASFTKPGESVSYTFYVRNDGEYNAYLNYIAFKNISNVLTSNKSCTAGTGATAELVTAACSGISLNIAVGSTNATGTTTVSNHSLSKNSYETVVVTITYASDAARSDGPFEVMFGDIGLVYSTNNSYVPTTF